MHVKPPHWPLNILSPNLFQLGIIPSLYNRGSHWKENHLTIMHSEFMVGDAIRTHPW